MGPFNNTAVNSSDLVFEDDGLSASSFEYSWVPPLIGGVAVLGFALNAVELYIIGTNRVLRQKTSMQLVAGNLN